MAYKDFPENISFPTGEAVSVRITKDDPITVSRKGATLWAAEPLDGSDTKNFWCNFNGFKDQLDEYAQKGSVINITRRGNEFEVHPGAAQGATQAAPKEEAAPAPIAAPKAETLQITAQAAVPQQVWQDKDKRIARECSIKAAVEYTRTMKQKDDTIVPLAATFFDVIWNGFDGEKEKSDDPVDSEVWDKKPEEKEKSGEFPVPEILALLRKECQDQNIVGRMSIEHAESRLTKILQKFYNDEESVKFDDYDAESLLKFLNTLREKDMAAAEQVLVALGA